MGDMNDAFDSPIGLAWALVKRHKQRKQRRKIQKGNVEAQGIIEYNPSQIEAFFDNTEPIGNILISGENEYIRYRALARSVECAYSQGYVPVVIHAGNYNLENYLVKCFGTVNVSYLNGQFPYYEPFRGLNDNQICHIIMNSTTDKYEIKGTGKYYIDGISGFMRAKGILPYLWMYITCPHMKLSDLINDEVEKGTITDDIARILLSQIVQGELERGNIENFFAELRNEAEYIIAKKNNLRNAVNIMKTATMRGAVAIDLRAAKNELLLNLLMSEIEMLQSQGEKVFLCFDSIPVVNNQLVERYAQSAGSQSVLCLSGTDVYSEFGGDDKLFYSVVGKASKILILKHMSSYSCQKFSEIVGEYDKQEINDTYTDNTNLIGNFSYSMTSSKNISVKRESIIKPEEIARLRNDEIFILDNCNGELVHTVIV